MSSVREWGKGEKSLPLFQLIENTDEIVARAKQLLQRSEIVSSGLSDLPAMMKKIGTFDRTERACMMHEVFRQLRGSYIGVIATIDTEDKGKGSYDAFVFRRPVSPHISGEYTDLVLGFDGSCEARRKDGPDTPFVKLDTAIAAREMSAAIQLFQALKSLDSGKPKIAEEGVQKVFAEAYKADGWKGVDRATELLNERCSAWGSTLVDSRSIVSSAFPAVRAAFPLSVITWWGHNRLDITVTESGQFTAKASKDDPAENQIPLKTGK